MIDLVHFSVSFIVSLLVSFFLLTGMLIVFFSKQAGHNLQRSSTELGEPPVLHGAVFTSEHLGK